jgi:mRNA-degrading endonuclease toxin of MazEF toxin-antitoxin module
VDIPPPVPGTVISYAYLWADEHEAGREEGAKDRPVAIVVAHAASGGDGRTIVVVVPITHTAPRRSTDALEIPAETKRRLGLDDDRWWVVLTETNVFPWPAAGGVLSRAARPAGRQPSSGHPAASAAH